MIEIIERVISAAFRRRSFSTLPATLADAKAFSALASLRLCSDPERFSAPARLSFAVAFFVAACLLADSATALVWASYILRPEIKSRHVRSEMSMSRTGSHNKTIRVGGSSGGSTGSEIIFGTHPLRRLKISSECWQSLSKADRCSLRQRHGPFDARTVACVTQSRRCLAANRRFARERSRVI